MQAGILRLDDVRKTVRENQIEKEIKNALFLKRNNERSAVRMGMNKDVTWKFFEEMGWIDSNNFAVRKYQNIYDIWKDQPCYVVGCGPSLRGSDFKKLNGLHTIGINHIVEDYDGFEFLMFLDKRFIDLTSYNLQNFPGRIIAQNNSSWKDRGAGRDVIFKTSSKNPTMDIENGLFNGNLTALCAVHFAILTGANPIYLMGVDCGGGTPDNYHYKKSYPGEIVKENGKIKLKKYEGTADYFEKFRPWAHRIINLSSISNIKTFKKQDMNEYFANKIIKDETHRLEIIQNPVICHVIGMKDMNQMGDISQHVFNQKYGRHIYSGINNPHHPPADLYLVECFLNRFEKYINFKRPHNNAKVISLIHSSGSCFPAKSSNRVVVLTEVGRAEMAKHGIMNCVVIPGAIDCNLFGIPEPNYSNHNFGRITRTGTGKIHPQFYSMVERILNQDKTAKCIMYTSNPGKIPMLKHARMIYDKSILINNTQKKAGKLRELSLYIHAHNGYQEVFSMAIAEAMATGLPIIVNEKQDSMKEQLGGTGIFCETIADVEKTILELLPDAQRKKEMGQRARARAKEFTIERMQSAYENLFREVLNDRS